MARCARRPTKKWRIRSRSLSNWGSKRSSTSPLRAHFQPAMTAAADTVQLEPTPNRRRSRRGMCRRRSRSAWCACQSGNPRSTFPQGAVRRRQTGRPGFSAGRAPVGSEFPPAQTYAWRRKAAEPRRAGPHMRLTVHRKPDGVPTILEKPQPPAPGAYANRILRVLRRCYVTYYTPLRGRPDDISKTRIAPYRSRA